MWEDVCDVWEGCDGQCVYVCVMCMCDVWEGMIV